MDIEEGAIRFEQSSGRLAQTAGDEVDNDRTEHTPEVDISLHSQTLGGIRGGDKRIWERVCIVHQFRPDKYHDQEKHLE